MKKKMRNKINKTFVFVFILIIFFIINAGIVSAVSLTQGDVVEVINDGGVGFIVRGPNACDPQIGTKKVYNEDRGIVLDGPITCNSYTRWKVRWSDGVEGWVPEAYPYPGGVDYLQKILITPSTEFSIGDNVRVNANSVNVRNDPPELLAIGSVNTDDTGTVIASYFYGVPKASSGFYYFWKIDYDTKTDGWTAENYLDKVTCTNECSSGQTRCYGYYKQSCINSNGCWIWGGDFLCTNGCAYGECIGCTPQCSGKECGDDGCGNPNGCGTCTSGTCNTIGQCVSGGGIPVLKWPLSGNLEDRQPFSYFKYGSDWTCTGCSYCGGLPKKHTGVDIRANVSEEVYASYDGVVKAVSDLGNNWAKGIVIEHSGFTTSYLHVNPIVFVNDNVTKGQKIATISDISASGSVSHLHYAVRNISYSSIAIRGALPQIHDDSNTYCQNDPLFPEKFVDPLTLNYNSSSPYSINFDVRNLKGFNNGVISADDITAYIQYKKPSSPMLSELGIGNSFITSGINNNVNPAFLVATAEHEGQFGTAGWTTTYPQCHNTMGWGIPSGSTPPCTLQDIGCIVNCMDSWGAMTNRVAYFIANGSYYYNAGKYTVDQIRNVYAAEPASPTVVGYMNDLYNFANNSTPCVPKTCSDLGKLCGGWDNGCQQSIDCGSCSGGQTCNANGQCVNDSTNTGWKSPSSTGNIYNNWHNPTYAYVSDNQYAWRTYADHGMYYDLQDYGTFGFGIPTGSIINGIEIDVEGYIDTNVINYVRIDYSGHSGNQKSIPFTTSKTKLVFGGQTDLWGVTWSAADFADGQFHPKFVLYASDTNSKMYVDSISAKVYYIESVCSQNSDCGTNGFIGGLFCSGGNVFQNFITYICNNPGTISSFCSNSTASQLTQNCGTNYCDSFGSNYCKNGNVYHSRTCYNKGCFSNTCFSNSYTDEQLVQTCSANQICSNAVCVINTKTISLNSNWNLISIPLVLQNNSIENVFGSIMDKVIVINGFEAGVGGGAKTYDPQLPEFSDLHEIDYKHGYWVKMNQSANLSVLGTSPENKTITLNENWNLISYLCNQPKNVSDVFSGIMNKIIVINGFENGALTYDPLLPEFSDLIEMKPYYGYWVKMNQSDVLDYNSVC